MSRRDLSARIEEEVSDFKIHDLNNWVADGNKTVPVSIETRSDKSDGSSKPENKHKRKLTYGTVVNSTTTGNPRGYSNVIFTDATQRTDFSERV